MRDSSEKLTSTGASSLYVESDEPACRTPPTSARCPRLSVVVAAAGRRIGDCRRLRPAVPSVQAGGARAHPGTCKAKAAYFEVMWDCVDFAVGAGEVAVQPEGSPVEAGACLTREGETRGS